MPRPRVLSFMSQWGGGAPRSPTTSAPASPTVAPQSPIPKSDSPPSYQAAQAQQESEYVNSPSRDSPRAPRTTETADKRHSRRSSMVMAYQPPVMEIAKDTPPELQPIFSFLNSHSNKLYQEGYFLKLHDLDGRGRPSTDRVWSECFAQLVGTVLSLWDAAQLDAAGDDGEVMPTFINLTDASIKMIESLPMNGLDGQSLQNVLSISTAANNRYLLHFNSLHSLTQWTAGIRLAMFEHSSLQEAYTGSIIAGKGKYLNNIRTIMERARFPTEDWARVRFGAGTPWRRCWCVINPPDDKELAKAQKVAKKRSAYEKAPVVRGDIKFYENKKVTKKTRPIATIKNAYAAYALYPQSKPLIDKSTLVKVEGTITIHSNPEAMTEGFVFVMPEVHPAITGFEMMIRWLLPTFDTFALYGRPDKLVAMVSDPKSLMFGMPTGRRYGFLDLIDVAGLIHTEGSQDWSERQWRKEMKALTSKRMAAPAAAGTNRTMSHDQYGSKLSVNPAASQSRSSLNLPSQNSGGVRFAGPSARSTPGSRQESPARNGGPGSFMPKHRNVSDSSLPSSGFRQQQHQRSTSDAYRPQQSSRLSEDNVGRAESPPPPPPPHKTGPPPPPPSHSAPQYQPASNQQHLGRDEFPAAVDGYPSDYSSTGTPPDHDSGYSEAYGSMRGHPPVKPVGNQEPFRPVAAPPAMAHRSNAQPPRRPAQIPDMARANSNIDAATLAQLNAANPENLRNGQNGPYSNGQPYLSNGQYYAPNETYAPAQNHNPYTSNNSGPYPPPKIPMSNTSPNPSYPYNSREENQQYYPTMPQSQQYQPSTPPQQGRRPGPPPSNYNQSNSNSGNTRDLPERRLPTIPGTPAVEVENFDLGPAGAYGAPGPHGGAPNGSPGLAPRHPGMQRERSSGTIARKPVPGR